MKMYTFSEEKLIRLASALNQIAVVGMAQAELLTVCKQVLDDPDNIAERETSEKEGKE